jgi:hypothetical protein
MARIEIDNRKRERIERERGEKIRVHSSAL